MLEYEELENDYSQLQQDNAQLRIQYEAPITELKSRLTSEDASLVDSCLGAGLSVIDRYDQLVQKFIAYCNEEVDDSDDGAVAEQVIESLVTMRRECQIITEDLAKMAANIQTSLKK